MYSNSLTGTLPASLGQLSKLTILYMSSNLLTGTLDNNQLSGAIPSSLCRCQEMYIYLTDNKFLSYPTCMTSSRYHVQVDENISVCDGPSYEDICESKSSKSMMIAWIVIPILFDLIVAASIYLYYRYRYRCLSSDSPERTSQYVDINHNNTIMDEDNDRNHDVHCDLSISEDPEAMIRYEDLSRLVGGNGASNEGRHQRRDNVSQVLEPVVIGELVSTVAGAIATDYEILNLPSASVTNIDEEDVLYVDLFVDV